MQKIKGDVNVGTLTKLGMKQCIEQLINQELGRNFKKRGNKFVHNAPYFLMYAI